MAKKNPFQEFIEGLSALNEFGGDLNAKAVDEALAAWIIKYYPGSFKFDLKRRDLVIAMIEKNSQIIDLIEASAFRPYIDAIIDMKWKIMVKKTELRRKKGERINEHLLLMDFAREAFSMGYALKSLEKKEKKKKGKQG